MLPILELFLSFAPSSNSKYIRNKQGLVFSTVPVKYLAQMSFRQYSLRRLQKAGIEKEASKKYFGRIFEIFDCIIDVGYKQKQNFKSSFM